MMRLVALFFLLTIILSFNVGFAFSNKDQNSIVLKEEQADSVIFIRNNKASVFPRFYFDEVESLWIFSFPKNTFSMGNHAAALSGGNVKIAFLDSDGESDCLKVVVKDLVEPLIEIFSNELRIRLRKINTKEKKFYRVSKNTLIKPDQKKFESINLRLHEGVSEDLLNELAANAGIKLKLEKLPRKKFPLEIKASSAQEALKALAKKAGMKIQISGSTWTMVGRNRYGKK